MNDNTMYADVTSLPIREDFGSHMLTAIDHSKASDRPFFILVLQIENSQSFKKRNSPSVVDAFFKELYHLVRSAVHQSQFVGPFKNGLGLVFDAVDVGHVDSIAKKLAGLVQNVIRAGKYNDLTGRWSDLIYQFLHPNTPGMIFPQVGWAIYPRDGVDPKALLTRALYHIVEQAR